ncbi:MAG: hypothetical protein KDA46_04645, partial [Parvularculaceae bacterium]|nr:hypothetical protein [Parvularculaceae bacterium]
MTRIQDPHTVPEALAGPRASSSGAEFIWDRDQKVPMRDGVELCVDIYRPAGAAKTPALLAIAGHNKDLQNPDIGDSVPPQPAWSTMWQGGAEAG